MKAVLVVHGGAWAIPEELSRASVEGVQSAARQGFSVLKNGCALDAVEVAVRAMEDNTAFDAGTVFKAQYICYSNHYLADMNHFKPGVLICGHVLMIKTITLPSGAF